MSLTGFQVPNVNITEAPIKNKMIQEDGFPTKVWLQLLTNLTDAVNGDWGPIYTPSFTINTSHSNYSVTGFSLGNSINISIDITDLDSNQGDTISISTELNFESEPTILDCYSYDGISWSINNGCFVENNVITLPTVNSERVIIKGNLIRKVQ